MKITINGEEFDVKNIEANLVAKSALELNKDTDRLGETLQANGEMMFEWCTPTYVNEIGEYSRKVSFLEKKRSLTV